MKARRSRRPYLAGRLALGAVAVVLALVGTVVPAASAPAATPPPQPPVVNVLMRNATAPKYRADMQAYSVRHYWLNSSVLKPQAIVLHFTVSGAGSWPGIINTWDRPEATGSNTGGENPQPAAHFIVEQNGTIYQTMPTNLMVRHAYGLNYAAIGIEFVEWSSAGNVLARTRQAEAGLALVRWLMYEQGIPASNVLGHGTANASPLFVDLTGARNDHSDWGEAEVAAFRARLGVVPAKPRALFGAIGLHYRAARLGYVLGAPTSDEMDAWLPGARVQTFQGGQMLWSRATGAHEVYGSIGSRYRSQLAELSPLGLPTSGERAGPLPASRMNTFQRGAIYWSLASGAHEVYGAIYGRYISLTTADRARLADFP